jgi:molybdopterin-guanine dinucleotide biosynthesis protein A
MDAPLYGLVLTGGRSTRMGQDKAALAYAGRTQLERAMTLIGARVERAWVSVRAEQQADPVRAQFAQIADRHRDVGPVAGILAAQESHPQAAWLVLACDLPLLDEATLAHLVSARSPAAVATAYRSSHDGLPEPLCAIYEPRSHALLEAYLQGGRNCPRKFLIEAGARLIDEPDPRALDNVNTPDEYGAASDLLTGKNMSQPKRLTVQYFALLREQAGRREEALESTARTPQELYQELRQRYPFTLGSEVLRVAVNSEFADWTTPLRAGDTVVFIPPVAGG